MRRAGPELSTGVLKVSGCSPILIEFHLFSQQISSSIPVRAKGLFRFWSCPSGVRFRLDSDETSRPFFVHRRGPLVAKILGDRFLGRGGSVIGDVSKASRDSRPTVVFADSIGKRCAVGR